LKLIKNLFPLIVFSLFIIFAVLYNFEGDSVLRKFGNNTFLAFLNWSLGFITLDWGSLKTTGETLVLLQKGSNTLGVLSFVYNTFLYGISGLILAFIISTILTYKSVFNNSAVAKVISGFINFLSGIHIILFCFIIKIVLGHEEGFHLFILIAISIGSYTYSDICQYQTSQFQKLLSADFITAARAWGDSVLKHARRSIAIGLLSQWNSLVGIVFASTIIVEYFFKIHGVGYAIDRYLITPNLKFPGQPVESEFFMVISTLVIVTVVVMSGVKEIVYKNLSKKNQ
tara:strand:- start:159 stop:1013 length:855 start_codon:yes stop_codon:yes gene_type:complete